MSTSLVGLVTVIYVLVAISLYVEGRNGMCIAFVGYALANLGFIYDLITKGH